MNSLEHHALPRSPVFTERLRTFKVKGKAFLFVGRTEVRLKLADSIAEARKLAAKEPDRYSVGANGWTKIMFDDRHPLQIAVVKRWIGESYQVMAPKQTS